MVVVSGVVVGGDILFALAAFLTYQNSPRQLSAFSARLPPHSNFPLKQ